MKEYIDCGVSGFRFDAAKHIETPDDGDYASDYWPYVLGNTTTYATNKGLDKPYYYGEILGTCGTDRSFSSYTKFMSVIDSSQSGDTLSAVRYSDTSLLSTTYNTKQDPDKLVLWSESHDNYANNNDQTTRNINSTVINKAYVIQASRKDAATLYYARPENMYVSMCSIDDLGAWQYPAIKAINKFHDRYVDKDENISIDKDCFINVRGKGSYAGVAIVNLDKTTSTKELTISSLKDGKYIDLVSKIEYTLSNHNLSASFTDGVSILIPKDDYVPEDEDDSYISSFVIEDAPTNYAYLAWVWGNNKSGSWKSFSKDQSAIGISLSSGDQFIVVEFPSGTTTNNVSWDNKIRQTEDMSYSGNQTIVKFNSLIWK